MNYVRAISGFFSLSCTRAATQSTISDLYPLTISRSNALALRRDRHYRSHQGFRPYRVAKIC